jgi:hypothetical protein
MPGLEERVALTERLIKAAGSLAGLAVPTVALVALGGLPDRQADTALIVLPAVSLALIVAIFVLGPEIGKLSRKRAATRILALAGAGALLAIVYSLLTDELVIQRTVMKANQVVQVDRDIRPISQSQRVQDILRPYRGSYPQALKRSPHKSELRNLMRQQRGWAIAAIFGSLVLAQLCFVAAIVGGAWWLAERDSSQ